MGQSLAFGLARKGIQCELLEVKPSFDIVGAGLAMQGTGMRAFEELGLADEIKAVSYSNPKQRTLFKDTRDEIIVAIEPGMSPLPPSVAISRKVLHETLAEKVADVKQRNGRSVLLRTCTHTLAFSR